MAISAGEIIRLFELKPHPEGGFYKETYRSERNHSTAILYLLPAGARSRLHRLKSDELFHFYLGGPMVLAELSPSGEARQARLGQDVASGCELQHLVRAGTWFGAYPEEGSEYSLVGCTVAPGFDFADFELGRRAELLAGFPRARDLIERLSDRS